MNREFAENFAEKWISAWNSHNLEAILSHYTDDFEMHSPLISERMGIPEGTLVGKKAVGEYWKIGLNSRPKLNFELQNLYLGVDSLIITYLGRKGLSSEAFHFNSEGKVVKAFAHYSR